MRRIGVQPGGQEQVEILGHVGARRDLKRRSPPLVQPRCRLKMPPCAAQCDTRTRCATLDVKRPAVLGLDDPPHYVVIGRTRAEVAVIPPRW